MPHALYTAAGAEVCLIVKDHKGEGHKEAKKRVKQAELARIAKVQLNPVHTLLSCAEPHAAFIPGHNGEVMRACSAVLVCSPPRTVIETPPGELHTCPAHTCYALPCSCSVHDPGLPRN